MRTADSDLKPATLAGPDDHGEPLPAHKSSSDDNDSLQPTSEELNVLSPFERFAFRMVRRMNKGAWKRFWTFCQRTLGAGWIHLSTYNIMNVYAVKMAGVFMTTTSTVAVYTRIAPRWIAVLGYALALILLLGSYYIKWCFIVLPIWVFAISISMLVDEFRESQRG